MLTPLLLSLLASCCPVAEPQQASALDRDHEFDRGSSIEIEHVSDDQVRGLALLGKVWGFLKYHHPRITSGERHWDYDLLRILPRVIDAGDVEGASAVLLEMVEALPPAADCAPCAQPPEAPQLPCDLAWLHDRDLLGDDLIARLEAIHRNRHVSGNQFYVSLQASVGNPQFSNEPAYAQFPCPDVGFRILALFRYWNIIRYWFPYRDLIGADWDGVLAEFLPRLVAARDADRYRLEMMALIARVHDTHANLWSSLDVRPPRGSRQLPVQVRFLGGQAVVSACFSPGSKGGGLAIGDVILALDDVPVDALLEQWRPYYAASNEPTMLRDVARSLTRGDRPSCRVRVERDGRTLDVEVARSPVKQRQTQSEMTHDLPGETFRLLSPEVAYLKLSSVKAQQCSDCIRAASGTRGLVIDLRNYPSEFIVFALGQHLVSQPTEFARFTHGDLSNPGAFLWTEPVMLQPQEPCYRGKIAILVDEVSQSQAEYTTMAFRVAPGAVVIGSTTAGADGNVSAIPLPGGLSTMISGIGVFYPDGRPTQRIGILADVEVHPTRAGLRDGRDEVLEAALRKILGDEVAQDEITRLARR